MSPTATHERHLTSPRQARHALAYVLNNRRHHLLERGLRKPRFWVDPLSSAAYFDYADRKGRTIEEGGPIAAPKSWMLTEGWQRAGPIPVDTIPAWRRGKRR